MGTSGRVPDRRKGHVLPRLQERGVGREVWQTFARKARRLRQKERLLPRPGDRSAHALLLLPAGRVRARRDGVADVFTSTISGRLICLQDATHSYWHSIEQVRNRK